MASTQAQKQRKRSKTAAPAKVKKPAGKARKAPVKTKAQKEKEKSDTKLATAAVSEVGKALDLVFGDRTVFDADDSEDSDTVPGTIAGRVSADLSFDRVRLAAYAKTALKDARTLKIGSSDKAFAAAATSLALLNGRLATARKLADRVARLQTAAGKAGLGATLTGLELNDAWEDFQAQAGKTDTTAAEGILGEIDLRIALIPVILKAYNDVSGQAAVGRIPADLLQAAGSFERLATVHEGLKHIPLRIASVTALRDLLAAADRPNLVPGLVGPAWKASISVSTVLGKFGGNATKAMNALTAITQTLKPASYFVNGPGGQRWVDLEFAGREGATVFAGAAIEDSSMVYGDPNGPRLSFQDILDNTEAPVAGNDYLPTLRGGEDPNNPRYLGDKVFGNLGVKGGMVLPYAYPNGTKITYLEYDIRPYAGKKRGRERVVVGDDGRKYYTNDHYKNFREIV
jgi:hypothetical protein